MILCCYHMTLRSRYCEPGSNFAHDGLSADSGPRPHSSQVPKFQFGNLVLQFLEAQCCEEDGLLPFPYSR